MFTNKKYLYDKTQAQGIRRKEYIESLVNEFHASTNIGHQEQVTANLANFAYDPINFQFLRKATAVELFLQLLTLPNERLALHGIAGLNNICLDPISFLQITKNKNIQITTDRFQSTENQELLINILALFYVLISENQSLKQTICTVTNLKKIRVLKDSSNQRLKLLADIFLKDFAARRDRNADKIP